MPNTNIKHWSK